MPSEPSTADPTFEHPRRDPRWLRWVNTPRSVWLLVGGVTIARLLWLAFLSPLTLTEDEAHYWLWSTAPDWSYATKPPGIAWVIWCSTAIFGHTEFAVRAPAALFGALGALAAADCARTLTAHNHHARAHTVAFVAGAITLLTPALALLGFITTIDSPLLACWLGAVALTLRGASNPECLRPWLLAAALIALGALFKHTAGQAFVNKGKVLYLGFGRIASFAMTVSKSFSAFWSSRIVDADDGTDDGFVFWGFVLLVEVVAVDGLASCLSFSSFKACGSGSVCRGFFVGVVAVL